MRVVAAEQELGSVTKLPPDAVPLSVS